MTSIFVIYHTTRDQTGVIAKCVFSGVSSVSGVHAELIQLRAEDVNLGRWKNEGIMRSSNLRME